MADPESHEKAFCTEYLAIVNELVKKHKIQTNEFVEIISGLLGANIAYIKGVGVPFEDVLDELIPMIAEGYELAMTRRSDAL